MLDAIALCRRAPFSATWAAYAMAGLAVRLMALVPAGASPAVSGGHAEEKVRVFQLVLIGDSPCPLAFVCRRDPRSAPAKDRFPQVVV